MRACVLLFHARRPCVRIFTEVLTRSNRALQNHAAQSQGTAPRASRRHAQTASSSVCEHFIADINRFIQQVCGAQVQRTFGTARKLTRWLQLSAQLANSHMSNFSTIAWQSPTSTQLLAQPLENLAHQFMQSIISFQIDTAVPLPKLFAQMCGCGAIIIEHQAYYYRASGRAELLFKYSNSCKSIAIQEKLRPFRY